VKKLRQIEFFKKYFIEFYLSLPLGVQTKYEYVFVVIKQADQIPKKFFKKIQGYQNLFEIRVEYQSNIYRTFCCLDGNSVVVLFNSFVKKTNKTPSSVLKRAEKIKNDYFNEKK